MTGEQERQKRKELDAAYSEYNELWRQISEMERRIEKLKTELGVEI